MVKQDCLLIGKVVKSHGIHGELIIETSEPELFENIEESVLLEINGLPVPFFIETMKPSSNRRFRVKFLWVDNSDQSEHLLNADVYISDENIDDDFAPNSPHALIGFNAFDQNQILIGQVNNYYDHSINPVLSIKIERKEVLIPFHPDLITDIDIPNKTISIDLPEGLLDIYL